MSLGLQHGEQARQASHGSLRLLAVPSAVRGLPPAAPCLLDRALTVRGMAVAAPSHRAWLVVMALACPFWLGVGLSLACKAVCRRAVRGSSAVPACHTLQ